MAHLLHSAFPSVPRKQSLMLSAAAPQANADDFRRGPCLLGRFAASLLGLCNYGDHIDSK